MTGDDDINRMARRMRSRYQPTDESFELRPPQRSGPPRPGCGTVYLHLGHDDSREHKLVTVAEWIDDYPEPDQTDAAYGHSAIEGDREAVLAWVRSRPAATFLVFSRRAGEWIPMSAIDDEIDIG